MYSNILYAIYTSVGIISLYTYILLFEGVNLYGSLMFDFYLLFVLKICDASVRSTLYCLIRLPIQKEGAIQKKGSEQLGSIMR